MKLRHLGILSYTYAPQALRYLCSIYWSSFMSVNICLNVGSLCQYHALVSSLLNKEMQT